MELCEEKKEKNNNSSDLFIYTLKIRTKALPYPTGENET